MLRNNYLQQKLKKLDYITYSVDTGVIKNTYQLIINEFRESE
jgi:hypothetical protein